MRKTKQSLWQIVSHPRVSRSTRGVALLLAVWDDKETRVISTPNFSSNKLSYVLSWFNLPRDSNISFLKGDLVCSLCGVHCRINPLPELSGSHEEQMLLLLGGYQDVVLVLSLFLCAVLECGDSVAVLLVSKPLSCPKELDSK